MAFTNKMTATGQLPPFQSLLDSHGDEVLAFLEAAVGPAAAEDCFQETFLAALRGYPRLEHGRELRAWLFTIARRKVIDHHRAASRSAELSLEPAQLADSAPSHPDGAADRLDAAALWAHVADLPNGQRSAVTLRFVGGLAFRDVAVALGCSEPAARRRVHDGLRTLRGRSSELAELRL